MLFIWWGPERGRANGRSRGPERRADAAGAAGTGLHHPVVQDTRGRGHDARLQAAAALLRARLGRILCRGDPSFDIERGLTLPGWVWSLLFYFFVPVLLGIAVGRGTQRGTEYRFARKLGMRFSHRIPTAWDYRFSDISTDTYVLTTLKDGTTVAGRMKEGSFAASAKDGRDLYIAELWDISEIGDWTPADPVRGMLLCGEDIRYVEFFGGE